jgi:hypothetical protein
MTSVMLTLLRHETLTSLTAIFFPRFRLWAGRPVGVLVEQSSEVVREDSPCRSPACRAHQRQTYSQIPVPFHVHGKFTDLSVSCQ